jgi:ketosteroid isomerase-like protein
VLLDQSRRTKSMNLADIVQRGWDAVGAGDFDALVADYAEDMTFIMPGQADVLEGRQAFRDALNGLGDILPPGFEIKGLRQIEGNNEVVSIIEWKADKVTDSQLAVLFKFNNNKIYEERWFVDTEQWKNSF